MKISIFWLRRDLRLHDNAALYHALRSGNPVQPIFIFDRNILDELEDKADRRVNFIHNHLQGIQQNLIPLGATLDVRYGFPREIWDELTRDYEIETVYTNHDYEPYARERDSKIADYLKSKGIDFKTFKDQVIFEKDEVLKDDGRPYTVFTPYSKRWKAKLNFFFLKSYPTEKYFNQFFKQSPRDLPGIRSMGFEETHSTFPEAIWPEKVIRPYKEQRDFPGIPGTSKLSVHLRFGTISIRQLARETKDWNETYLNELIWREFYHMILWHFPHVVNRAFKPDYDNIKWRNDPKEFEAWCQGQTGYPIVDAGMRELNETGYMHNRVRMIVASFLTKHLLIDWRWGEAYFAKKLNDFDLAANNGGWQWAAGSGCDAAPYFRVFNPYLQTLNFDPELTYIRKWVPEFEELTYPRPIVAHEAARDRCLKAYASVLKK